MNKPTIILLGFIIIIAGCNLPTQQAKSPEDMTSEARTRVAEGVSDELTRAAGGVSSPSTDGDQPQDDSAPIDIETPTPSLTPTISATPTVTQTPTSDRVMLSVSTDTNCRYGPGSIYDYLGAILVGESAEVFARNDNSTYYYIRNPDNPSAFCWAWGEYATITGNTSLLPVFTPPPTPTLTPSPTYTPIPLNFNLFSGADFCFGNWWLYPGIENTGPIPLESISITAKLDNNETRSSTNDMFSSSPGCLLFGMDPIGSGQTGFTVVGPYSVDPNGHTVDVTATLCSQDGGAGVCLTKSMTLTVSSPSDEDVKDNIDPIDPQEILARLLELPISTWNYDWDTDGVRHIGPMAQDFYEAFSLGDNDRSINPVDSNGVAFAAIQALSEQLEERDAQMKALGLRLEALETQINTNQKVDWSTILITVLSFTCGVLLTVIITSTYWRRKIHDEDHP